MPERFFFAIWPDEFARHHLEGMARFLHGECGGKLTWGESIHLTLVFLGAIDTESIGQLRRIASGITENAFEIGMDQTGYWQHNRIAWAGMRDIPPELGHLVAALRQDLTAEGFEFDARPYFPHITLVRKAAAPKSQPEVMPFSWFVDEFCLVGSSADGYSVIDKWPLRRQNALP